MKCTQIDRRRALQNTGECSLRFLEAYHQKLQLIQNLPRRRVFSAQWPSPAAGPPLLGGYRPAALCPTQTSPCLGCRGRWRQSSGRAPRRGPRGALRSPAKPRRPCLPSISTSTRHEKRRTHTHNTKKKKEKQGKKSLFSLDAFFSFLFFFSNPNSHCTNLELLEGPL